MTVESRTVLTLDIDGTLTNNGQIKQIQDALKNLSAGAKRFFDEVKNSEVDYGSKITRINQEIGSFQEARRQNEIKILDYKKQIANIDAIIAGIDSKTEQKALTKYQNEKAILQEKILSLGITNKEIQLDEKGLSIASKWIQEDKKRAEVKEKALAKQKKITEDILALEEKIKQAESKAAFTTEVGKLKSIEDKKKISNEGALIEAKIQLEKNKAIIAEMEWRDKLEKQKRRDRDAEEKAKNKLAKDEESRLKKQALEESRIAKEKQKALDAEEKTKARLARDNERRLAKEAEMARKNAKDQVDGWTRIGQAIKTTAGFLASGMWKGMTGIVGILREAYGALMDMKSIIFSIFSSLKIRELSDQLKEFSLSVFEATDKFRTMRITLTSALGSQEAANRVIKETMAIVKEYPITFSEAEQALRGFTQIPPMRRMLLESSNLRGELEETLGVIQKLAIIDPLQGIQGALYAFREAMSGELLSLKRRFEVPVHFMAASVGATMKELKHDAELTRKAMIKFFGDMISDKALKEFGLNIFTQINKMRDEITKFLDLIGRSGVFEYVSGRLFAIRGMMETFFGSDLAKNIARNISAGMVNLAKTLESSFNKVVEKSSDIGWFGNLGNLSTFEKAGVIVGKIIRESFELVSRIIDKIDFRTVKFFVDSFKLGLSNIGLVSQFLATIGSVSKTLFEASKTFWENLTKDSGNFFDVVFNAIDKIGGFITKAIQSGVKAGMGFVLDAFGTLLKSLSQSSALKDSYLFGDLIKSFSEPMEVKKTTEEIKNLNDEIENLKQQIKDANMNPLNIADGIKGRVSPLEVLKSQLAEKQAELGRSRVEVGPALRKSFIEQVFDEAKSLKAGAGASYGDAFKKIFDVKQITDISSQAKKAGNDILSLGSQFKSFVTGSVGVALEGMGLVTAAVAEIRKSFEIIRGDMESIKEIAKSKELDPDEFMRTYINLANASEKAFNDVQTYFDKIVADPVEAITSVAKLNKRLDENQKLTKAMRDEATRTFPRLRQEIKYWAKEGVADAVKLAEEFYNSGFSMQKAIEKTKVYYDLTKSLLSKWVEIGFVEKTVAQNEEQLADDREKTTKRNIELTSGMILNRMGIRQTMMDYAGEIPDAAPKLQKDLYILEKMIESRKVINQLIKDQAEGEAKRLGKKTTDLKPEEFSPQLRGFIDAEKKLGELIPRMERKVKSNFTNIAKSVKETLISSFESFTEKMIKDFDVIIKKSDELGQAIADMAESIKQSLIKATSKYITENVFQKLIPGRTQFNKIEEELGKANIQGTMEKPDAEENAANAAMDKKIELAKKGVNSYIESTDKVVMANDQAAKTIAVLAAGAANTGQALQGTAKAAVTAGAAMTTGSRASLAPGLNILGGSVGSKIQNALTNTLGGFLGGMGSSLLGAGATGLVLTGITNLFSKAKENRDDESLRQGADINNFVKEINEKVYSIAAENLAYATSVVNNELETTSEKSTTSGGGLFSRKTKNIFSENLANAREKTGEYLMMLMNSQIANMEFDSNISSRSFSEMKRMAEERVDLLQQQAKKYDDIINAEKFLKSTTLEEQKRLTEERVNTQRQIIEAQQALNEAEMKMFDDVFEAAKSIEGENATFMRRLSSATTPMDFNKMVFEEQLAEDMRRRESIGKYTTEEAQKAREAELARQGVDEARNTLKFAEDYLARAQGAEAIMEGRNAVVEANKALTDALNRNWEAAEALKKSNEELTAVEKERLQMEFAGMTPEELIGLSREQVMQFSRAGALNNPFLGLNNPAVQINISALEMSNPQNINEMSRLVAWRMRAEGLMPVSGDDLYGIGQVG